jgi:hypothetical protein
MFEKLCNLVALMSICTEQITRRETTDFLPKVEAAENGFYLILHDGASYDWRAYFISGSLYLYMVVRKLPLRSPTYEYVVQRLKNALSHTEIFDDNGRYPPFMLLWILFIGGIASYGRAQREWFRVSLATCRRILALGTWEDALQILEKLTPFSELEFHGRDLWMELG